MELAKLNAQTRENSSKGALNALRRSGRIPAVCYANQKETVLFSVDAQEFNNLWDIPGGRNTLFAIEVDGSKVAEAIVYEVQRDLLSGKVTHIDFMFVDASKEIKTDVAVKLVGTATGVRNEGGTLSQRARKVRISCLPTDIPEAIEFDVTNVPAKTNIYLKDLDLKGATLVSSPQTVLLSISKGRLAK